MSAAVILIALLAAFAGGIIVGYRRAELEHRAVHAAGQSVQQAENTVLRARNETITAERDQALAALREMKRRVS